MYIYMYIQIKNETIHLVYCNLDSKVRALRNSGARSEHLVLLLFYLSIIILLQNIKCFELSIIIMSLIREIESEALLLLLYIFIERQQQIILKWEIM